jgi:hypothetical protein
MPQAKGNIRNKLPLKKPTRMTFWTESDMAYELRREAKEQRLPVPDYLERLVLAGRKATK